MDGKRILTFFILLNVLTLIYSFVDSNNETTQMSTPVLDSLFSIDKDSDLLLPSGLVASTDLTDSVESAVTPQTAGANPVDLLSIFLDTMRMTLAFITLLTPLPILDMVAHSGMPLFLLYILIPPIFLLYLLALIEFIRGASFGK